MVENTFFAAVHNMYAVIVLSFFVVAFRWLHRKVSHYVLEVI